MKGLSIFDKIKVVVDITMANKIFFVIMALLIFLSVLFATTNRKNAKDSKKTYGIIYLVAIICVIVKYYSSLSAIYDNMMDNLFIIFYFPNISVYIAAIITTNIIMWISMFSNKTKKITRIVNSIVFFLMHYILILILNVIANNNLDVFDSVKLYQNNNVHSLIELSSNIFIIWIIYLVIYKILINYLERKMVKNNVVYSNVVLDDSKSFSKLRYYISSVNAPIIVKRDKGVGISRIASPIIVKREEKVSNNNMIPESINLLKSPVIVKRDQTKIIYTAPITPNTQIYESNNLDKDYKEVLEMLQKETSNRVDREEEMRIEKDNEDKLSQLMELYRVI